MDFIRYALLGFGVIALFVGAFVIFNTLSITVAQRTRELATLRTLGATRGQVLRSVVLEAFVVGLVASLVGIAAGVALAKGLTALFAAANLDLPRAETVFATRTWVVALALGTLVTLAASVVPALRATKVSAIAAVREGATAPRGRLSRYSFPIALGLVGLSAATLAFGLFLPGVSALGRVTALALGTLVLFVGVAMVSTRLVTPLARVLGWPGAKLGGAAGRLARGNAVRMPARTAATAAALMIGIALVTFVTVVGQGLRASERDAIEQQIESDYVIVSQNGWSTLPASVGRAAAEAPGIDVSSSIRRERGRVLGDGGRHQRGRPAHDRRRLPLRVGNRHGERARLARADRRDHPRVVRRRVRVRRGRLLHRPHADREDAQSARPGGVRGVTLRLDARQRRRLAGDVRRLVRAARRRRHARAVEPAGRPAGPGARPLPDARVVSDDTFVKERVAEIDEILNLLYALLALSVIVSLFGMVNTLVLSVFERTREIGMLRAVGLTRRQTRRMIRHESVVTALIGAALGLPLGILLAAAVTRALSEYDLSLSVPLGPLFVFACVAVLAGIAAAVLPARRAARLNVLQALQYE